MSKNEFEIIQESVKCNRLKERDGKGLKIF